MENTSSAAVIAIEEQNQAASYVEWGPVFAGAVLASAISLVLFMFGGGVGLSVTSPWQGEGASASTIGILTMAWVLIVMIFSFICGGYIAGRLRRPFAGASEDAVEFRDGAHGLVVWATGMLIGAALTAQMSAGAVNLAASSATTIDANRIMWNGEAVAVDQRDALAAILESAADGELDATDREYAAELVAANSGLSEAEARSRIDAWESDAREAVDEARAIGAVGAFLMAASALVASAAAYFSAGLGGRHRDANSPFPWTRARAAR